MASVTLTDNQWKALLTCSRGAPAGGSIVVDVTAGLLTITTYPQPNAAGTAQLVRKFGPSGEQK